MNKTLQVDGSGVRISVWYVCDPVKNKACKKNTCVHSTNGNERHCDRTSHIQFAMLDGEGKPIIAMEQLTPRASPDVPEPP